MITRGIEGADLCEVRWDTTCVHIVVPPQQVGTTFFQAFLQPATPE